MISPRFTISWKAPAPSSSTLALETEFTAEAAVSKIGKRVIRFYQQGKEYARAYKCCWGHYYNCSRARIGIYCSALDAAAKPWSEGKVAELRAEPNRLPADRQEQLRQEPETEEEAEDTAMPGFEGVLKAPMDRYYCELGEMTALFTDLDVLIRDAVMDFLGCPDERIAAWLVAPVDFTRKIDMLAWLIDYHAHRCGLSDSNEVQSVADNLSRVKTICNKRNDHVHGTRIYNPQQREYTLVNPAVLRRKASKPKAYRVAKVDAKELSLMNRELMGLIIELHFALPELRMRLECGGAS